MKEPVQADVIVIGAGPVGLTLAMDLGRRGVRVVVLEKRVRNEPPSVKCNHVSSRSMEIFRSLGIAAKVRDAGLPSDYPHDIAYRTTMTGRELCRIHIPSTDGRRVKEDGPDTWWPTPEPPHRINQLYLEPILFEAACAIPSVEIRNRLEFEGLVERADGVEVTARDLDGGGVQRFAGQYLVGCDGGSSSVRRQLGIRLSGDAIVQRVQSTYIRSAALIDLLATRPAWGNFSVNTRRCGNVYAIDGRETWLVHNYLRDDEPDFNTPDRDKCIRDILGVDDDFKYETISDEDWYGRRLIADRLRVGRTFICGDAAHLWVPYAGYGMNAGIADAANLSWLLAAKVNGWGGAHILDAYESERLPITDQVSRFAMRHSDEMAKQRRQVPSEVEQDNEIGEHVRQAYGRELYDLNVQQYCCAGLNFGYYYEGSPIILYDGEAAPAYSMGFFTPSTVPGCRTPHAWVSDGKSLYDEMGADFALLRLDRSLDAAPILKAAEARGVPIKLVDISQSGRPDAYRHGLVLSRPDKHVAWRGDTVPADAAALIDRVIGAAPSSGE
ncbi:FAD-dependent oxidoreductase [Microbacteriaceae bacterium K1510]|nr:FAD-dependent oxidoreductase [Microbacteriaceae bacterium K1510]